MAETAIEDYWIKYRDGCTKFFFAKMKQRKMAKYMYSIYDTNRNQMTGFDQVAYAMNDYDKHLLVKQVVVRSNIDLQINQAVMLTMEQ